MTKPKRIKKFTWEAGCGPQTASFFFSTAVLQTHAHLLSASGDDGLVPQESAIPLEVSDPTFSARTCRVGSLTHMFLKCELERIPCLRYGFGPLPLFSLTGSRSRWHTSLSFCSNPSCVRASPDWRRPRLQMTMQCTQGEEKRLTPFPVGNRSRI